MKKDLTETVSVSKLLILMIIKLQVDKLQKNYMSDLPFELLIQISSWLSDPIDKGNFAQCSRLMRSAVIKDISAPISKTEDELRKVICEKINKNHLPRAQESYFDLSAFLNSSSFFINLKKNQIKFFTSKIDDARESMNCQRLDKLIDDLKTCLTFSWVLMAGNGGSGQIVYLNSIVVTLLRYFHINDAKELYSKQNPIDLGWLIDYQIILGCMIRQPPYQSTQLTIFNLFKISRDMYLNNPLAKESYKKILAKTPGYANFPSLKMLEAENEEKFKIEAQTLARILID